MSAAPNILMLAGPNGAGKSTAAPQVLDETLGIVEFVNADVIAQGLSGFSPEGAALEASRIMLARLRELAQRRVSFALETTLASKSYAPWLRELIATGYRFHLVYFWVKAPELSVSRVALRVRSGGHDVPEETIRRRYWGGIRNLFELYMPLATVWRVYDTSDVDPILIASGNQATSEIVHDKIIWARIKSGYEHAAEKK